MLVYWSLSKFAVSEYLFWCCNFFSIHRFVSRLMRCSKRSRWNAWFISYYAHVRNWLQPQKTQNPDDYLVSTCWIIYWRYPGGIFTSALQHHFNYMSMWFEVLAAMEPHNCREMLVGPSSPSLFVLLFCCDRMLCMCGSYNSQTFHMTLNVRARILITVHFNFVIIS